MKTLKITDLALQAVFSLGAFTALALSNVIVFFFFLLLIGATHIVSSVITVCTHPHHDRYYRGNAAFLLSIVIYLALGGIAWFTGLLIAWLFLLLLLTAFWYIWHTALSIEEYRLWRDTEDQRNLLDLGN